MNSPISLALIRTTIGAFPVATSPLTIIGLSFAVLPRLALVKRYFVPTDGELLGLVDKRTDVASASSR
jgi:hypothetical protein